MKFIVRIRSFQKKIMNIGVNNSLESSEITKLYIFNQLNFLGFITGITVTLSALLNHGYLPPIAWIVACSPTFISGTVLLCNHLRKYNTAMFFYFTLYPVITALVYAGDIDAGIELFFIFYAILSVFFLKKTMYIFLSFTLSASCYLIVYILKRDYQFKMADINFGFYFANHLLAIVLIFVLLYMTKKENTTYRASILKRNIKLKDNFRKITIQKDIIKDKARLLEAQTSELTALNNLKDKLFSIIAHDLKTPIYGLKNLFSNMQRYDIPAEEIKILLPDILKDLNYTTGLMENLLHWAKSQMKGEQINMQLIDITNLIADVQNLMRLQAEIKKVYVRSKLDTPIYIYADKNMMDLVLRNLVSNAIKFTPENGSIYIGADNTEKGIELFVEDNGTGMTDADIRKIHEDEFFTTKGTANEYGTGLGLKLCKDFLKQNGAHFSIISTPGKGSKFSCNFPKP
jgi:two-component system, sensor histidine kinase and response regulator